MNSTIRRICLYGGPGSGKSTTAGRLFGELRACGHSIELVSEYVKNWAYENHAVQGFDQLYIMAKQVYQEERFLRHVPLIVTDAPLLLMNTYAKIYNVPCWAEHLQIALEFERRYPACHIFLDRQDIEFKTEGRWSDLEAAQKVDQAVLELLASVNICPRMHLTADFPSLLSYVRFVLERNQPSLLHASA